RSRRGNEHHDRRRPGSRWWRYHSETPGREVDARREGAPDRRGDLGNPAARERPVSAPLAHTFLTSAPPLRAETLATLTDFVRVEATSVRAGTAPGRSAALIARWVLVSLALVAV